MKIKLVSIVLTMILLNTTFSYGQTPLTLTIKNKADCDVSYKGVISPTNFPSPAPDETIASNTQITYTFNGEPNAQYYVIYAAVIGPPTGFVQPVIYVSADGKIKDTGCNANAPLTCYGTYDTTSSTMVISGSCGSSSKRK